MKKLVLLILTGAAANAMIWQNARAAGISVDAGLTPPEDRWIIRSQFRVSGCCGIWISAGPNINDPATCEA
jgi:hypothetical protein